MTPKIVFTGGGTAGHVTPNIALIDALKSKGWAIDYIGSVNGIEKLMIQDIHIPYHEISTGKFRRYFSWKNFSDPFKVLLGIGQAIGLMRKIRPHVVFSKGGFVAFPVVFAAWLNRIPVLVHESDLTPGLANRLSLPFATKICVTFAAAKDNLKHKDKVEITGTPIRPSLLNGSRERGLSLCNFNKDLPCILVMGGSQGSVSLNQVVRDGLKLWCDRYQVIHICGKDKLDNTLKNQKGYCQFEYVNSELPDVLAASDVVITRGGANSLYELLVLAKPHVVVPLSAKVSRGDQVQNANYFKNKGVSIVVNDDELDTTKLLTAINEVTIASEILVKKMKDLNIVSATDSIVALLEEQVHV